MHFTPTKPPALAAPHSGAVAPELTFRTCPAVPMPNLATVSATGMTATSGTTGSAQITTTRIVSNFGAGRNIAISGDAASTNLTGLTGITNPSIILQSGSVGTTEYYPPIQFRASQSFTDGTVTITTPLVAQQGAQITGVATQTFNAPATNTQNDVVVVNGASIDGQAYTNVFFGMQDYPGSGDAYKDAFILLGVI